jgi:hypothetical protein
MPLSLQRSATFLVAVALVGLLTACSPLSLGVATQTLRASLDETISCHEILGCLKWLYALCAKARMNAPMQRIASQ